MKKMRKHVMAFTLMLVMMFAMTVMASAERVPVDSTTDEGTLSGMLDLYGMTQTDATKSSATVSWPATSPVYYVYKGGVYQGVTAETTFKVTGLIAGSLQEIEVIGYVDASADPNALYAQLLNELQTTGDTTMNVVAGYAVATPGKPENVASAKYSDTYNWFPSQNNSVTIGWTMNKNDQYYADGWKVEIKTVDGKKKLKTYNVAGSEYTQGLYSKTFKLKAVNNTGFSVKVQGYVFMSNGAKKYGTWSGKKVVIPQAKVKTKKKTNSSMTVSWTKIKNATKYEVYLCKNADASNPKYKKVATLGKNKTSYVVKNMKTYQKYGVWIKATVKYGKKTYKSALSGYNTFWFTY
ncbi:MAG: fibronectin type III domain-containing protein [Lachnospiraceae bacterium]|nr:fibronectin type III domain-containing protein [Lachnospiraceae bacterium]